MSDKNWQKVHVAFDDADGNRVEAVMWQVAEEGGTVVARSDGPNLWIEWNDDFGDVTVTRIYDLPTGAGAVIRLGQGYGDLRGFYISDVSGSWWSNSDGNTYSSHELIKRGGYEVLSEGIQLGDLQ